MTKKIDVAGILLDNCSVRETLDALEQDMSEQGFHAIEEVNMDTLMLADSDESVREALDLLDHTVICETGILEAVGEGTNLRRREVERHDFFAGLLSGLGQEKKTVYLIGDTAERTQLMLSFMQENYPDCDVIGTQTLDGWDGMADPIVNEINAETPDVILSILPSPMQEQFLLENRDKFSAGLWYGIGALGLIGRKAPTIREFIQHYVRTRKLQKKVRRYQRG